MSISELELESKNIRKQMKFINSLDENLIKYLNDLIKNSPTHRIRIRAHAVLLSYKKYSIDAIADIFEVHRDTISRWLDSWHDNGISGLQDAPKPGRPRTRNKKADVPKVKRLKPLSKLRRMKQV